MEGSKFSEIDDFASASQGTIVPCDDSGISSVGVAGSNSLFHVKEIRLFQRVVVQDRPMASLSRLFLATRVMGCYFFLRAELGSGYIDCLEHPVERLVRQDLH